MKIIFDRSAFHGSRFDLLQRSRLLQLTKERKVLVFHTSVFIEETVRMRQSRNDELKRQVPFLLAICNGGWFRPLLFSSLVAPKSVCREELEGTTNGPLIHYFLRRQIESHLRKLIEGPGALPELDQAAAVWQENEQKKKMQRALLKDVRRAGGRIKGESFSEYYQSVVDGYPQRLIQEVISVDQPDAKALAWSLDPAKFPHFTAFAELFAYGRYDAEQNQHSPLDWNWQSDAEQLCFLVDVDLIVSSDQQFMRRAFDELWKPKGKRMLTPEELVKLL